MDELLEQLRWLLNLPVGATAADVLAQLQKLQDQIKAGEPAATAASFDLVKYLSDQRAEMVALKADAGKSPDPAKFVEIATLTAVQGELSTTRTELAALKAEKCGAEVDRVVTEALSAGKLTPAMEAWAKKLGGTDLAALKSYVDAAPVVAKPGATQTGGKAPDGAVASGLTEVEMAICKQMGVSAEDFAKARTAE